MRAIATAVLGVAALTVLASSAFGQDKEDDAAYLKRCLAAITTDELQQCVRQMAKLIEIQDRMRGALRDLASLCAAKDTVQETRECLTPITRPATPEEKKQSDELEAAVRTWEVSKGMSRMDSSGLVHMTLESEDEITVGYGKRARPVLALRCRENTTALFINSDWYLAENVSVQWRIDQEKPVAQTWAGSTNHKAAGLWDGGRSIPLIKSMLGKKAFLVRVTTYNDGPREMSFNIEGLDKVIEPLRTACKW